MDCSECGFVNPDGARFCGGCGKAISNLSCDRCENINAPGSRFCVACGNSLSQYSLTETAPESQAERRLLTVMFCDLVDSTTIVDSLDPEDTRTIIREFQYYAKSIIEQFGGRITEYLGDGIVAQFTRHETNAERALNAGLELIRKLEAEKISIGQTQKNVMVRCGIATGLAVVGDMLGDDRIRSESAIGLPLNLAARIQGLANPNTIVIAGDTYQLTHGLFEFEDIGFHTLKGIKTDQQVWRVLDNKKLSSRFMAHTAKLSPMVDREEPMKVLLDCWDSSKRGHADTVVFTGEAGIGKSRIVQELENKISADDFHYLQYQCAPYHTNTAFYPVISRLHAVARFDNQDTVEVRLQKLEAYLRRSSINLNQDFPVYANLLGLPVEDKWSWPNLDPDEMKQLIFKNLMDNMFFLSTLKPLLIKIEDVHWIDPTTLELMSRIVKAMAGQQMLLLITSRPGFEADFLNEPNVTLLEVERLPQEYSAQLIQNLDGIHSLPKAVVDEIINRTEGIPLFAEELSKSLLQSIAHRDKSGMTTNFAQKDIPTSLHDSLLSRLDLLPKQSKSIAQFAAVIGRDFSFNLLEEVTGYREKNLYQDLMPLLESQLIFQDKAPPSAEFCFKHAMVRDVAYENLLQSERVEIHKRIAFAMEAGYPEIVRNTPNLLARHFTEGKELEKAIEYWLAAGIKASQQFAMIEAREHLSAGLAILDQLQHIQRAKPIMLEYLITLGPVLIALEGAGAEITRQTYTKAVDLGNQLPESALLFTALWGQWQVSMDYEDDGGIGWADKLVNLSTNLQDSNLRMQAHHCQWTTLFHQGEFVRAHQHIEDGLGLYDPDLHVFHSSTFGGHDPKVCGHSFLACTLWMLGKFNESIEEIEKSIAHAKAIEHTGSHFHAHEWRLLYFQYTNDQQALLKVTNEFELICQSGHYPEYKTKLIISKGMILAEKGELDQGIALMNQGLSELRLLGTLEDMGFYSDQMAKYLVMANRHEQAKNNIETTLADLKHHTLRYWHAELHRRKGEILAQQKEYETALVSMNSAYEVAKKQSAVALQLRALISLYRLNQSCGLFPDVYEMIKSALSQIDQAQNSQELILLRELPAG